MGRLLPFTILLLTTVVNTPVAAQLPQRTNAGRAGDPGQENHLKETGSSEVLFHSAFAHGYRHGYEEGYHLGNIDVNLGRLPRKNRGQFHGVSQGYSAQLGPRKSFDAGFEAGLQAGYSDGFTGRSFRAVEATPWLAKALEPAFSDSAGEFFDHGLATGYSDGFRQGIPAPGLALPLDSSGVACAQSTPPKAEDAGAENSYCEGYRRGFVLGYTDGLVRGLDRAALEAVK